MTEHPETPHGDEPLPVAIVSRMSIWWKAGGILALAIGAGATASAYLTGFSEVPAQMRSHETRIEALESAKVANDHTTAMWRASVDRRFERIECLVISQRRETPVEDCL